jgi:RNA polymerase sigma-70 factor (ECF subfamily)
MKTKPVLFNEIDDQELVNRAAAGSREAFGELVSRHHRLVRSMLWRVLGDQAEIDDVAQEVFMSALSGVAGFRQQSSFPTWLLSIARNKAISHLRSKRNRDNCVTNRLDQLVIQHQIASIADGKVESPALEALQRCLERLPSEHRQLIQAVYFEDRSPADVARESGQARNTVRMRLMRIRRALSGCIKRQAG